jgi:hypothetical protein
MMIGDSDLCKAHHLHQLQPEEQQIDREDLLLLSIIRS